MYDLMKHVLAGIAVVALVFGYVDYKIEKEISEFKEMVRVKVIEPYENLKARYSSLEAIEQVLTDKTLPSRLAQPRVLEMEKENFQDEHESRLDYFRGLIQNDK